MWKSTKSNMAEQAESATAFDFTQGLNPEQDNYAVQVVDRILRAAIAANATDVHFEIDRDQTAVRWRVDGTLVCLGCITNGRKTSILNRIKALAKLITYRSDVPQEGRLVLPELQLEARVGTLPTLHGERAVIRLASARKQLLSLQQIGLRDEVYQRTSDAVHASSGVILICGPAGSGKTTTAYACLRELSVHSDSPRSLVTLEDPIEIELPGVAQSQINPTVGYDWASGLKALLRQDPEVMLVGEIRDAGTAAVVFEAAMTGQLVITTMHARSASDAVRRLLDMQVPTHHLLSVLNLLICQRLLRAACSCRYKSICTVCNGTGYSGRFLLSEVLPLVENELARAILAEPDSKQLEAIAKVSGMCTLMQQANEAIEQGRTTLAEFKRHFQ